MEARGYESPMEWEYQNGGPVDETSPFYKHTMSHRQNQMDSGVKKRGFSVFDSPMKATAPALREPASQPFLFSKPSPTKPFPAFRNPSFTTPRKLDTEMVSSGAENPSSPDNADNEDTPEGPKEKGTVTYFSSRAERKTPVFGKYGYTGWSPGRGEIPRGSYSNAIAKRVHKRRRRELDRALSRRGSQEDSDYDNGRPNSSDSNAPKSAPGAPGGFASTLTFFEMHPHLPDIILKYAHMLFNLAICAGMLYFVYSCWSTIKADVDKKAEEAKEDVLAEMRRCAENFVQNRCNRQDRVPAMETVCENWEKCMNMNPDKVGRAKISAHTWAEILNSFLEPFSFRSIAIIVSVTVGVSSLGNFFLIYLRHAWEPSHGAPQMAYPPHQAQNQYPATPSHYQQQSLGYYPPYNGAPAPADVHHQLGWKTPRKVEGGDSH